jgi:hypothetical protein
MYNCIFFKLSIIALILILASCEKENEDPNNGNSNVSDTANYAGLILNIKSGELYELGVVAPTSTLVDYYGVEFHDYDPVSNKVFFWANDNKLGILDLTELNLKLQEVPIYLDELHKKVLHLDLENVTVSEVLDINNLTDEYLFEPGMVFKVSAKGNFLISCTRMYDFQKMVIEYDDTTGTKLSEWKLESAPLESIVSSLTQIF